VRARRDRGRGAAVAWLLVATLAASAVPARALGALAHATMTGPGPPVWEGAPGWLVEAAEQTLYGLPGVHVSSLRVAAHGRRLGASVSLSQLATPIGTERRATAALHAAFGRSAATVAVDGEQFAPAGYPAVHLAAVSWAGRVDLVPGLAVAVKMERRRLAGAPLAGVDAWVMAIARARAGELTAGLAVDRVAGAAIVLGMRLRRVGPLALEARYDGARESVEAALAVDARGVGAAVAWSRHAVLGESRGVRLRWRR
jgi:hypothetical protein